MSFAEYADYDGLGLAELVKNKDVSPQELVEAAIVRAERHNGTLNAIVHKAWDAARNTASTDLPDGPFKGVPFLIKDLGLQVKDWPITSGSRFLKDQVSAYDSELIRRYREAGLVFMGKTNTPEFGITGTTESLLLGPCRNPWNPDHISGGSSGGAASATAAGIVPLAHASDGLGSIRIPAACCGLVGMKITRDRNPQGPVDYDRAIGMSVDHIVSRTVRDSATMLDATGYAESNAPYATPKKDRPYMEEIMQKPERLRIACWGKRANGKDIDPEIQGYLDKTADLLRSLGHDVTEACPDVDLRAMYRAQGRVSASAAAAAHKRRIEVIGKAPEEDEYEPLTWAGIRAGQSLSAEEVMGAWQELRVIARQILAFFDDYDVWVNPVLGTSVPKVGLTDHANMEVKQINRNMAHAMPFTPPMNITGQPAISLPLWQDSKGLPVGIMFAGRYADEATLFRLAAQLEKEMPWLDRKPQIWD